VIGSLQFRSGKLLLEAALYVPDAAAAWAVVVCHPHPLRGGDMYSNVVTAAARSLQGAGFAALTFNFRGAGASQGIHDEGRGEQDDVRAALEFALSLDGIQHVGLAGYSFGAGMALAVAAEDATALPLALVSLPTANPDATPRLQAFPGPLLLMAGDADHVSSAETLSLAARSRPADLTELVVVPNVDHFWRGYEPLIEQHIGAFFARRLAPL